MEYTNIVDLSKAMFWTDTKTFFSNIKHLLKNKLAQFYILHIWEIGKSYKHLTFTMLPVLKNLSYLFGVIHISHTSLG